MAKDKSFFEKLRKSKTDEDVKNIYKEEMEKAVKQFGGKVEFEDLESGGSQCFITIRDAREERMKKRAEEMKENFEKGIPEDFYKHRLRTKSCDIIAFSSPKFDNLVHIYARTDGFKCANLIAVKEFSRYVDFMKNVQMNKKALVNENTLLSLRPLRENSETHARVINSEADFRIALSFFSREVIYLTETLKTKLRNKDKYFSIVALHEDNPPGNILIPEDEFSDYVNFLEEVKGLI